MVMLRMEEEANAGVDIVQAAPVAATLSDKQLGSRCAACFRRLGGCTQLLPCKGLCKGTVSYCSTPCYDSDIGVHLSSSECYLLSFFSSRSCELRAALRCSAGLSSSSSGGRINGLLSNRSSLLADAEFGPEVKKAARIMLSARHRTEGELPEEENRDEIELLENAACIVITNGVVLEFDEGQPPTRVYMGIAVYGPGFSWFNHSCRPNSCYRFVAYSEAVQRVEKQLVKPDYEQEHGLPEQAWESSVESKHPRVVVRSLRTIAKDEEVTITYTDLLQPKCLRQRDLQRKYRFLCSCQRCTESYSDVALEAVGGCKRPSCSGVVISSDKGPMCWRCRRRALRSSACLLEHLEIETETASGAFLQHDDPERCAVVLENALWKLLDGDGGSPELITNSACLDAFITLRSSCRVLADARRRSGTVVVGYSVLLAGIVQHLYNMGETGLATILGLLWLEAGLACLAGGIDDGNDDGIFGLCARTVDQLCSNFQFPTLPADSRFHARWITAYSCLRLSEYMSRLSAGEAHPLTRYVTSQLAAYPSRVG